MGGGVCWGGGGTPYIARMPLILTIFLSLATSKMSIYSQYALQILSLAK